MPERLLWDRHGTGIAGYWTIQGRTCRIYLEQRPPYCDRGNFLAKIEAWGNLGRDLDHHDGWPRYYMDIERAVGEIEDWLRKRGQLPRAGEGDGG